LKETEFGHLSLLGVRLDVVSVEELGETVFDGVEFLIHCEYGLDLF